MSHTSPQYICYRIYQGPYYLHMLMCSDLWSMSLYRVIDSQRRHETYRSCVVYCGRAPSDSVRQLPRLREDRMSRCVHKQHHSDQMKWSDTRPRYPHRKSGQAERKRKARLEAYDKEAFRVVLSDDNGTAARNEKK